MKASGPPSYVLDASAILAVLLSEPGAEQVSAILDRSSVHTVNVAEVIQKLVREGVPREEALISIEDLQLPTMAEFPMSDAAICGELIARERKRGLGLGDCICLTAAAMQSAVAVTAERLWKTLDESEVGGRKLRVQLIR